jgi:hypothetical protein
MKNTAFDIGCENPRKARCLQNPLAYLALLSFWASPIIYYSKENTKLCCVVLCCVVLCCVVLCCVVLCCAVLCCVVLCSIVLYSVVLCFVVLFSSEYKTIDKVQKPSTAKCNIPSSEPFRTHTI